MTKNRVYIVFRDNADCPAGNEFIGVFFSREAAADMIAKKQAWQEYYIEVYEEPGPGQFPEVFC